MDTSRKIKNRRAAGLFVLSLASVSMVALAVRKYERLTPVPLKVDLGVIADTSDAERKSWREISKLLRSSPEKTRFVVTYVLKEKDVPLANCEIEYNRLEQKAVERSTNSTGGPMTLTGISEEKVHSIAKSGETLFISV